MKIIYLIFSIAFLLSCNTTQKKEERRSHNFIVKIKEGFDTGDKFIKIEKDFLDWPKAENTIAISYDTAYWMWAKHNQFGENGVFVFGHIMTKKENNYNFDSAMYRWSVDTTSLLVTYYNSISDSSVTYIYTTEDHGDGSYTNSTNELIW